MKSSNFALIDIFQSVATDNQWFINALEVAPDHIHLLVEYDIMAE